MADFEQRAVTELAEAAGRAPTVLAELARASLDE
jgi:hypothetical protein